MRIEGNPLIMPPTRKHGNPPNGQLVLRHLLDHPVAAEMVAATAGLGQMVLNASSFLRTDVVVMGIVLIGLIAWLFDLGMRALERRLVPWKGRV